MARQTIASTNARLDAFEARFDRLEALIVARLDVTEPAKQAPAKPAVRKPAKKATTKPATKGSQTRETLSRKEFNRTVTAKARLAGGDTYKRVLAAWDQVQALRETSTPDEVLALFVA